MIVTCPMLQVGPDAVQHPVGVDGFEEENDRQTGLHDDAASIKLDDVETPHFDEATASGGVILLGHTESESECGQLWETLGRQSVDSEVCISGTNLLDAIFDQEVSLGSPIHWPKRFDLDDVSINVRANSTADVIAKVREACLCCEMLFLGAPFVAGVLWVIMWWLVLPLDALAVSSLFFGASLVAAHRCMCKCGQFGPWTTLCCKSVEVRVWSSQKRSRIPLGYVHAASST